MTNAFVVVCDFVHIIYTMRLRNKMYFPYSIIINENISWLNEISDLNDTQEE